MADSAGTEGAGRVADVLLDFLEGPGSLGVSALARDLGLSKAVVHRILRTLVQRGLLETDADTREYRLGPSAAALDSGGPETGAVGATETAPAPPSSSPAPTAPASTTTSSRSPAPPGR